MTDPIRPTPEPWEAEIAALRQRVAALEAALTTHDAAEQAAQDARRYAEQVVATLHEALLVLDGDLRVMTANPAFYRLFNVTPEETKSCLLYELGNQQWNIPQLRQLLEELLLTDNATIDRFEVTHTFPHLGRRTMHLNARRFELNESAPVQILLAIEDITVQKEAETSLLAQRDWFNGALSSIGDGVIATDVHGRIIFLNPVAEVLTGWSLTDARGRPLAEVFHIISELTRQPVVDDPVSRVLREGRALGLANHTILITRYGAEIPIADSAAPIRDQHGVLHGVVLVFRDGTSIRQLEAQLQEKQKMEALGTLAGGVAHNFNNMLAIIIGFNELLHLEVPVGSPATGYVHEVNTASLRAKELVQQMLAFSRRDIYDRYTFELRLLVHDTLQLQRASLPTNIDLRVQLNNQESMILANPAQIQQVLMNLTVNAEYAMRPTGGILTVRLDEVDNPLHVTGLQVTLRPGPHLRLIVQDTGSGIPSDVLPRIFEPFFTTKPVGEGTGMGLALAHGIIGSYEGAITAESIPDQGTTMTIYLPRLAGASSPVSASWALSLGGRERLIVVEDDLVLARMTQEQLTRLGYIVRVCTSSIEALTLFQAGSQACDLVLIDQTLPHMSGDVLAQELRRLRPELPVILLTGSSPLVDTTRPQALGIDAFLIKPLTPHELTQTIRQVLIQRQALPPLND